MTLKKRNKSTAKSMLLNGGKASSMNSSQDYEIYVPPEVLEELKSKA